MAEQLSSPPRRTQNGYTEDALPEGQYIDEESGAIYDAVCNVVDHLAAEDQQEEDAYEGEPAGDAQETHDEYGMNQQDVGYAEGQKYETGAEATGTEEAVEGEGAEGEGVEVEGGEGEGVEGDVVEGEEVEGAEVEGEGVEGEVAEVEEVPREAKMSRVKISRVR